jgi:hypothetical protein
MPQPDKNDDLILEGIIVTIDSAGQPNIAPMGPRVDRNISRLLLRPYKTARTYDNLKATRVGVFHVTDDCLLLARAAIGQLPDTPLSPIPGLACPRLADCCRWFTFEVTSLDDASERTQIECRITQRGEERPFFGFNRAKHAVVEAAILATRLGILSDNEIHDQMQRLEVLLQKTAGHQERAAFTILQSYIAERSNYPKSEI